MKTTLDLALTGDLKESADFVVIGSGAGGGVVAQILASAGKDVILLESGPYLEGKDFTNDTWDSMKTLYWEQGFRAMQGKGLIPTMQARCVGGTTVVNSSICFRLPDPVYQQWAEDWGLDDFTPAALKPSFDRVMEAINIHPSPDDTLGRFDTVFGDGCRRMGYRAAKIHRNVKDCVGCGLCQWGCQYDAHLGTDLTYVPRAIDDGCRLYANCHVEKVRHRGRRATGVTGRIVDPVTKATRFQFEIEAKTAVVMAAGVMHNPVIWKHSRLPDKHNNVGRHLCNHPGVGSIAILPTRTDIGIAVPQGYESSEFRNEGIMFETLGMPPEVAAIRTPFFGQAYHEIMLKYHHMAMWGTMIRAEGRGRVRASRSGRPKIAYFLAQADLELMKRALFMTAEIAFAAGATELIPGINGMPKVLKSVDDARQFKTLNLKGSDMTLIGNHPMGTMRMGADLQYSVVDSNLQSHEIENLFVIDASIFPSALGVNPMWSIMAFADHAAHKLVDRY